MRGGRPGPHPEKLKFQIWPSSLSDKCNLILWWKLSFLWKSEPDPTHLRGVLSWFSCWWYPRYMHSQYMYFELGMYFLMNTLLISLLVVPTLAKNTVYSLTSALLVKIWYDIPEITPHEGGQTRSTPRKTEIPNMALEFVRQIHFNSMMKTEFPVKIWTRSNPFKGCFELIFLLMVPSLHDQQENQLKTPLKWVGSGSDFHRKLSFHHRIKLHLSDKLEGHIWNFSFSGCGPGLPPLMRGNFRYIILWSIWSTYGISDMFWSEMRTF